MNYLSLSLFRSALVLTAAMVAGAAAAQGFVPPAISTSSFTTPVTGYQQIQAVDVTDSGTVIFAQPQNGQLLAAPAGGSPSVVYTLAAGSGGYPKGIAADHIGNAYITDYSGHLWQVNLASGAGTDILAPCGSLFGYYLGTQSVAVDGQNNVYVAGNGSGSGTLPIVKITQSATCSTVATGDSNSYVAADGLGNVFYTLGNTNIYEVAAGSTTSTLIASGLTTINGLHADAVGNLYVTNSGSIDELPYINGAPSAAAKFVVVPNASPNSIGSNSFGVIATSPDGSSVSLVTPGALNLGAAAKGSTTASGTLTLYFNSPQTVTGFRYTSGAGVATEITDTATGTCAPGAYTAGSSCTLILAATPSLLGARRGTVQALVGTVSAGSAAITVQGTGSGLNIDPGTQVALGTGYTAPAGIAVDAIGNTVVVDSSANTASFIASGSTTSTVIATGLNAPAGVSFAADGTVYIANTGAGSVVSIPRTTAGAFGAATTVATGLSAPSGITVGNDGSVYVADGTKLYVYLNNAGKVNFSARLTLSTALNAAAGLATDPSGSIFVADRGAGAIVKFTGGTKSTVVSGLSSPLAVSIDPSGSLLIATSGSSVISLVPYVAGSYNVNATTSLGSALSAPVAVALDGSGNLYVADKTLPAVLQLQRTAATLNLGRFNVGQSSAAQSLTLTAAGTTSTTLGSPLYIAAGNTTDFTLSNSGSSGCSGGGILIAGSSCAVSAVFNPTDNGVRTETLTFSSDAANASSFTGTLTGTGIDLPNTTTTLTQVTAGNIAFGQAVQVKATVALQSGTGTPTGTVQFYVNGNPYGTAITLSSNAALQTLTGLPAGNNIVTAVYSGDTNFGGSTSTQLTVPVSLAATSTSLTVSVSSATPVLPSTSVTLRATVSTSVTSTSPSGNIIFSGNGQTIATVALAGGVSTYTGQLPLGNYNITARYSGDAGFATSTSNPVAVSIRSADFDLSGTPTSLTVTAPGSVTTTFTVTPIATYTGGIDLSCSGLPANSTCTFIPAVINFQNDNGTSPTAKTVQLVITTNQGPTSTLAAWILPLGGLPLLILARRKKLGSSALMIVMLLLLASFAGLTGCGSSNSFVTAQGTSTVTVNLIGTPTGTSTPPTTSTGNITKSFSFTLNVK